MNRKNTSSQPWRISSMASHLPQEAVIGTEPAGEKNLLSAERIRQLAQDKRSAFVNQNKEKEEKPMKKIVFRTFLVAAIVCVTSITVFAAAGGLDYIRQIFGDSAESIQNQIDTPHASQSANGRDLAVEAMVTDGYVTNIVVSLTGREPDSQWLFELSSDVDMLSVGYYSLEELSTSAKTYYVVSFTNQQAFQTAEVTLSLDKEVAPIALTFQLDNKLGNAVVEFPQGATSGSVQLKELQISPMGFLLVGAEQDAKGGLPSTEITVVFSDGSTEELEAEFDDGDGKMVSGGGGVILDGGDGGLPLVTVFQGTRNPDGEIVVTGQFSRIISPEQIEAVIIHGETYTINR